MNPDAFAAFAAAPTFAKPQAIGATSELRRIRDAPWAQWELDPRLPELVERLTAFLRAPGGTMTLRPVQAAALRTLHDRRGAFCPILTGGGKTLLSLLAATVMDAQRPLLLVPAALRTPTIDAARDLSKQWRIRPLRILSYEALGRVNYEDALERYAPDLVIGDECDMLKNTHAGVTRRVGRYVRKHEVPQLYMSGSVTSRSLRDYWHLIRWALGDAAPLPANPMELMQWAFALDEKIPEGARIEPGALLDLSPPEHEDPGDDLGRARARYGRRLRSTFGVVATGADLPPVSLTCAVEHLPPTPAIADAVRVMRNGRADGSGAWETPCGLPFETAIELWRHERELSCGMYYRWKVQPPGAWLAARRAWSGHVREILSRSRTLDTPEAVLRAIDAGRIEGADVLAEWREQAPTFVPETEPVWICDSTLQWAAAWLERERGIVWVVHRDFGRRLSVLAGAPYFHTQGQDDRGVRIDKHAGPCIASIASCSRGFNLQYLHRANAVITSPTKNKAHEQLISRTHRSGQERPVSVLYLQRLEGDERALTQSRRDATYVEQTTLQPQRLGVALWQ